MSNATKMIGMFMDAIEFNQNISPWDTSNVKYMAHIFEGASNFDKFDKLEC